jgi:ribosome modulation factor
MSDAYLKTVMHLVESIPTTNEKICYAMGYDCGMNGADAKNCHFSLFSKPEYTRAWEDGKRQAENDKQAK